jgi:hypothetical protein
MTRIPKTINGKSSKIARSNKSQMRFGSNKTQPAAQLGFDFLPRIVTYFPYSATHVE